MNVAEIQEQLRAQGLDGWLFFDHHRRDPLAYRILGFPGQPHVSRRWYYFLPAHGEPAGLVHRIEANMLGDLPGRRVRYSGWAEQADGIRDILGGAKRVAMQYSPLCAIPYIALVDAGTVELVRSLGVEVVTSAELVQHFEARLTQQGFELHMEAGRRMDVIRAEAFRFIANELNANVNEYTVQQFVRLRMREKGLVTESGPIVGVNANAADPHYEPSAQCHRSIHHGDFVLLDMWAKLDHPEAVFYDITWTGVCSKSPGDRQVHVFNLVAAARDAAIDKVKTSIASGYDLRGFEVDDAAREVVREAGLGDYFVHRTGHSIGQEIHGNGANMDNLETHDERRVSPWTCFSIEPGVYLDDFGIRSEVNLFVKDQEAMVTGEIQRALVTIA